MSQTEVVNIQRILARNSNTAAVWLWEQTNEICVCLTPAVYVIVVELFSPASTFHRAVSWLLMVNRSRSSSVSLSTKQSNKLRFNSTDGKMLNRSRLSHGLIDMNHSHEHRRRYSGYKSWRIVSCFLFLLSHLLCLLVYKRRRRRGRRRRREGEWEHLFSMGCQQCWSMYWLCLLFSFYPAFFAENLFKHESTTCRAAWADLDC